MTLIEALENARELIVSEGYVGGDILLDLDLAISKLENKYPQACREEF